MNFLPILNNYACTALCYLATISSVHAQQLAHKNYTIDNGLPSNYTYMSYQDSKGFMWIGTDAGVSRYDSYKFENYSMQQGLADNDIFDIYEDSQGRMWFRTYNGRLCYFKGGEFHNSDNDSTLRFDQVSFYSSLLEDEEFIWFGTKSSGIIKFNKKTLSFTREKHFCEVSGVRTPPVYSLWKDENGDIWTLRGKCINNLTRKKCFTHRSIGFKIEGVTSMVKSVLLNKDTLVIAENKQFLMIDTRSMKLLDKVKLKQISDIVIYMNKDDKGQVWIGTEGGAYVLDQFKDSHFKSFDFVNGLSVSSIKNDNEGNTWLTTLQNGVYFLPSHKVTQYTNKNGLPERYVSAIDGSNNGDTILIGQRHFGTFIYQDTIVSFKVDPQKQLSNKPSAYDPEIFDVQYLNADNFGFMTKYGMFIKNGNRSHYFVKGARSVVHDDEGKLWIGGNELIKTDYETLNKANDHYIRNEGYFKYFKETYLVDTVVQCLKWTNKTKTLWIGLNNGLFIYRNKKFINLTNNHAGLGTRITDIIELKTGAICLSTAGNGLIILESTGKQSRHLTAVDGLNSNTCNGLYEDENGNIWVATNQGLNQIVTQGKEWHIRSYSIDDGILSNKVNDVFVGGGKVYAATELGLSVFNVNDCSVDIPIHITDVKVLNKPIISFDGIDLNHNENELIIEFASLDYRLGGDIGYRYKIKDGQQWNYSKNNTLEFPSLSAGRYKFVVQAQNQQGNWSNQQASFTFHIKPPFWKTWYAYLIYFTVFLVLVYGLFKYEIKRQTLKSALKLQQRESKKLKELEVMKSRFFSNVSHEFRTPLTLILGPLERIIERTNESGVKNQLKIVQRNASSLLHHINQLLEIAKLESGKLELYVENKDIRFDITTIAEQFKLLADNSGITFNLNIDFDSLIMGYDSKKFEMILNNVLSNAVKFTPKNGTIALNAGLCKEEQELQIEIADSGQGISDKDKPYIFERFHQSNDTKHIGTGIGLAITKELIELHGGNISFVSTIGDGTTFCICLPIDLVSKSNVENSDSNKVITSSAVEIHPLKAKKEGLSNILIIEDNIEMGSYIAEIMNEKFNIDLAINGEEGMTKALSQMPDLIISDVMMPYVNGIELLSQLKKNQITSHIPVVLLTAKSATESKVEGYSTGAEAYFTKPFNDKELVAQVEALLEQRRILKDRFIKDLSFNPAEIDIPSSDQKLLKDLIQVIEENINNADFDISEFTKQIGMSRTQLHCKLKSLTGQSSSEFIRTIRLKRAAQLLQNNFGNIAEITHEIGFKDQRYFSTCFKKQFGMTPSEYKNTRP